MVFILAENSELSRELGEAQSKLNQIIKVSLTIVIQVKKECEEKI